MDFVTRLCFYYTFSLDSLFCLVSFFPSVFSCSYSQTWFSTIVFFFFCRIKVRRRVWDFFLQCVLFFPIPCVWSYITSDSPSCLQSPAIIECLCEEEVCRANGSSILPLYILFIHEKRIVDTKVWHGQRFAAMHRAHRNACLLQTYSCRHLTWYIPISAAATLGFTVIDHRWGSCKQPVCCMN